MKTPDKQELLDAIEKTKGTTFKSPTQRLGKIIEITNGRFKSEEILELLIEEAQESIGNHTVSEITKVVPHLSFLKLGNGTTVAADCVTPKWFKVMEFHNAFNHPISMLGNPINRDRLKFRTSMIFEENSELAEASACVSTLANDCINYLVKLGVIPESYQGVNLEYLDAGLAPNIVEIADAIWDLDYFIAGLKLETGVWQIDNDGFNLVHANNMTKLHRTELHAYETINVLRLPPDTKITPKGNGFLLTRADGKLIKPHDHVKVEISTLFEKFNQKP